METNMIAKTIAAQIGNKAFFMIGAKNLMDTGKGLQFDVGTNGKRISRITVTLEPSDTYSMKFYKGRGLNMKEIKTIDFVYAESLHGMIEVETGLYVSL